MNQQNSKALGRQLTAGWLCGLIVFNSAMYGCSGAPGETVQPGPLETEQGSPGARSESTNSADPESDVSNAPTAGTDSMTPAAKAIMDMSLDQMVSRVAVDAKGLEYETKFEQLAQQLLIKEAADETGFMASMEKAFGPDYDRAKAEEIRQQILRADFSWAPEVRVVSDQSLGGALGAYETATGTVYVSAKTTSKFERTFIYLEELGHHLDTLLNAADAPGDEGALFRIALTRQAVDKETLALISADNHVGTMIIDGQTVEVELFFGGIIDWIGGAVGTAWNGLKTGAGYVWKGATTAGSALQTAASKTWDGATTLSGWIARGADYSADLFVESLHRDFWAGYHAINGAVNVLLTAGHGTLDALKVMQQGVTDIYNGNFVDGTAAIFTGLAKLTIEMPFDTAVTAVFESITVLQTALFLEPIGRPLTEHETAFLGWIFGSQWWLPLIRVKEGFAGIYSAISDRPFTSQFNIYLKDWSYSESLMVHETTHVWQWANGGGDYKLESIYQQYVSEIGYNWEASVNEGVPWAGLGVEQQAGFVEAAFANDCYADWNYDFALWAFTACHINGTDRSAYFNSVDQSIWAGAGAP